MNETRLKAWVMSELKMDDDPERFDPLWQLLKNEYYVGEVLAGDRPPKGLLEKAREQVDLAHKLAGREKPLGRPQARRTPVEVELSGYERECAAVVSAYLAKQAAFRPEVRRFRAERLGSSLLMLGEASDFLRNELLAEGEDEDLAKNANLETIKSVSIDALNSVPSDELLPSSGTSYIFAYEEMFGGSGGLMTLRRLSSRLAALYPWEPEDALWWVLTGEVPEVSPLTLTYSPDHNTCSLTFLSVISEGSLRRAYRKAQEHVRHGGDNRPLGEKTLAVLRFVSEQSPGPEGDEPTWEELRRRWNGLYPEWAFKTDSGLRRAYHRAAETLAPYHHRRETRR